MNLFLIFLFLLSVPQVAGKSFTVVIDPGHGGKDPGARSATIDEKTINLSIALKLGEMISNNHKDVNVIYTRKTDKFIELDERANIANRNKADLFISIHTNAVKSNTVRGTETFTLGLARTEENLAVAMRENSAILLEDDYLQKYEGFDPNSTESYIIFEFMQNKHMEQSITLASEIQKAFKSHNRVDRGVRQAGLLVLRKTSMPSVLVELGFISNREEERYMKSAEGQRQLTKSLYDAFCKYKKEYDRKQGALANSDLKVVNTPVANNQPTSPSKESASAATKGQVVYKVQFLTSSKQLSPNSKLFKGYKNVSHYYENGLYKYTYGESTSLEEMKKVRRQVIKDFKDAFIVAFKDGKKVKY
ncbi:MAG: N-acetylmuramoyl-L-alanine amidase [Tannerellaceae bacterium]|nr:N-acetylmuramoyl-L-alanine amidase [Tannerellaceae bacterium]